MPDWKFEMKRAIYEKNLKEGKEKDDYLLMMNVLSGRTPDEFIDICKSRLEKAQQEDNVFLARARVNQDKVNLVYDAEVQKINETYNNEVAYIGDEAPRLASAKENMDKQKKAWDAPKSIEEVWETVCKENGGVKKDDSFTKTKTYDALPGYQKITFESYYNSRLIFDSIEGKEQMLGQIGAAIEKRDTAIRQLKNKKPDLLNEQSQAYKDIAVYESNINQMTYFKNHQYADMLNPNEESLSEGAKKAGTDLLASARAEYRNNLNGWQRMWANILPSWMYSKAAYVDKINAYKEVLQEAGFSKEQIDNADPTKSSDYVYSKATKRYMKMVREENNEKVEETNLDNEMNLQENKAIEDIFNKVNGIETENEEPIKTNENIVASAKNNVDQKDFRKGLGEVTDANNMENTDKSKAKSNNGPQIQQGAVTND